MARELERTASGPSKRWTSWLVVVASVSLGATPVFGAPGGGGGAGGGGDGGEGGRAAQRAMTPPDENDGRCGCELDPFGVVAVAGLVPTLRLQRRRRRGS